jgi:hypothetical protein
MLEREPVQGTAAFDRICAEVKSSYFPEDIEAAKEHFQSGPLKRARPALVRRLLVGITKSHMNDKNPRAERRRQLAAIGAIIAMHRETAEQVLSNEVSTLICNVNEERLWAVVEYCHHISETWEAITNAVQGTLQRYIQSTTGEHLWWVLLHAVYVPALRSIAMERLTELSLDDLRKSVEYAPTSEYIPAALQSFRNPTGFRNAEAAGECMLLLVSWFSVEHVRQILEAVPTNSQIWYASGMPHILSRLFEETESLHAQTREDWQELIVALDGVDPVGKPTEWYTELKTRMVEKSMLDPSAIVATGDEAEKTPDEPSEAPF